MKMRKIIAVMAAVLMLLSILPMAVFAADTYEQATSIAVGDTVVLVCTSKKMELSSISTTSTKYGIGTAYTSAPTGLYPLTVEAGSSSGTYSFKCPNGQYLYWTSGNSLATNATKSANTSWTVTFSGNNAIIKNAKDTARQLQWNASSPRFACYGNSGQTAVQLFKLVTAGTDEPECEHVFSDATCTAPKTCSKCGATEGEALGHDWEIISEDEATCTAGGSTTYECAACGEDKTETIPALPHNYVDGFCSECGEAKPLEATIDFSTTDQRTEYSTTVQVWENDGLTVTNNKGASTSSVGNYYNPARFYKSSQIIISYEDMTKLVINAPTGQYGDPWADTLGNAGLTYTVEGGVYTIAFATPVDSVTLTTTAQIRANSITAYGSEPSEPSDCEHNYVSEETQAPTCGEDGVKTYTCSECGDSYTEEIPATGEHNYEGYVCPVCGDIDFPANNSTMTIAEAIAIGSVMKHNTISDAKYYITGVVESVANTQYGNLYIKDAEGNKLYVYGTYNYDGSVRYDKLNYKPVPGDELTLYTVIGNYNGAQLKNAWIDEVIAHDCAYDNAFDADCNICGAVIEIVSPIAEAGTSASEDVRGVAARFTLTVEGMGIDETTAIYDNATVNGYKLISMGAVATNGVSSANVAAVYLCDDDVSTSATYAIRIKNIPEGKEDVTITFTPYFVVEIDGEQVTVYGEVVSASYASAIG